MKQVKTQSQADPILVSSNWLLRSVTQIAEAISWFQFNSFWISTALEEEPFRFNTK